MRNHGSFTFHARRVGAVETQADRSISAIFGKRSLACLRLPGEWTSFQQDNTLLSRCPPPGSTPLRR